MTTKVQLLNISRDKPVVIETPLGYIRITQSRGHRNRIMLDLPNGLVANVGNERSAHDAKFLETDENGIVRPKHTVLISQIAEDGSIDGVAGADVLRISA